MTTANVRVLAQADPTPTIVTRWGEAVTVARERLSAFEDSLRELDKLHAQLAERDLTVSVDLGQVGNAAAAARRDLDKQTGQTFALPKGA
jgi:hypothetical protein